MQRRGYFLTCLIFLGSSLIFGKVFAANTDVIFNEIGAYEPSGYEWIEIWNKGSEPVDMANWKLWEENGASQNHKLTTSTTDSVIAPGEYGAIVQDAAQFISKYPNFFGSIFDSSFTLNESGEEIGLIDANGNSVEKFTYIPATHFSLQRKDPNSADYTSVNWAEQSSGNTLGAINIFDISPAPESTSTPPISTSTENQAPTPAPITQNTGGSQSTNQNTNVALAPIVLSLAGLKINELVVDPGDANEWVEVYNSSSVTIDLTGAMICDSRNTTSTCKKISGTVTGMSWLQIDLKTRSFLNNSGDSVILKNAAGIIIDRIDYDQDLAPDQGQSLARTHDGVDTDTEDDWIVTDTVTPDAANVISGNDEDVGEQSGSTTTNSSSTAKTTKTGSKKQPSVFVWNIEGPSSAAPNEQVVFNAESTADPRGGSLSFRWVLENGSIIVGPELVTSFASSGTHTVALFVSSTSGYGEEKKIEIAIDTGLSQNAEVVISEIFPNPDGGDTKEFIELKNNTKAAVNLFGWFLRVGTKKYTFLENTFIPPEGFLVFYKGATKLSLVNTAGKVELLNRDKFLMDIVKYNKPKEGQSFSLVNNEWKWREPSPGQAALVGEVLGEKITKEIVTKKSSTSKSHGPLIRNIADVRQGEKGQPVKIQGVVGVLPNVFGSQFFYIVGDGSGIEVYQNKKDFPPLGVGDLVEITGTVSEASGIKRVNVKNSKAVDILSLGNKLNAVPLDLDNIEDSMVGSLVEISGEITEMKSTFMYVDNGADEIKVYFKKNTRIDKQKFKEGENVKVAGILEKVKDEWQLWPRSKDDLESLGMAGEVLGEKINMVNQDNTSEKYLLVTVAGVVSLLLGFLAKAKGAVVLSRINKLLGKK
jgi:DNA/RNA endonuclease YhcR with UshA esterase domain